MCIICSDSLIMDPSSDVFRASFVSLGLLASLVSTVNLSFFGRFRFPDGDADPGLLEGDDGTGFVGVL